MVAYEELRLYKISSIKRVPRKFHVVVVQNNGKEMYKKDFFSLIRPIEFLPFSLPLPFSITIFYFFFALVNNKHINDTFDFGPG